ncbi:hypothetical protein [Chryseobacterium urinae]|uniref:Uncharacterized protein n=1 Tax=Chryseobacterium urinae TaxID=3058400 RepID=A0ABT8U058_9FLAO|nr:hypothetical protein [Chryseobacterium sp. APV1]MDO3424444.1 hypothetical protein [Chryseobacterium sp. APV1]
MATTFSSTTVVSSLFKKELMLKPEEIPGLDKGFEVFLISVTMGSSGLSEGCSCLGFCS